MNAGHPDHAPAKTHAPLRCLVLGDEPLVVRCLEILQERGHALLAVVSAADGVRRWAAEHGVSCLSRAEYAEAARQMDVDLLLSITHPALIALDLIQRARVAAINYHDGPLPRYAGMNGSAWALHNGEREHAVVWHLLTEGLDEGAILERRDVSFDERETSLSLNMKNSVRALEGFRVLVRRLEQGDLRATPQRTDIARTVYSRHDRPEALCIIDWRKPAAQIDHLVRACDFGPYPNTFGTAKIVRGAQAVAVRESMPVNGSGAPGTLLAADDESLTVATGTGALRLSGFASPAGASLAPAQVLQLLGVRVGERLSQPSDLAQREALAARARQVSEAEPFYLRALSQRMSPSLPLEHDSAGTSGRAEVELPSSWPSLPGASASSMAIAAFAFLLSCLLRDERFDLALASGAADACAPSSSALMCRRTPWRVHIDPRLGFDALAARLERDLQQLSSLPGFLFDLVARHPVLREQGDLARGALSSVAVLLPGAALPPGARLGLALSADAGCALVSDGTIGERMLASLAQRLAGVARRLAADARRPLSTVLAIDDVERERQLGQWNATQRAFPAQLRLHDLFEQQVRARPDAVAALYDGRSLSFAQLDRAANRVANALQARGVGPGRYVGLLVERGLDLIVAMLGVAKSGAAYVPIDTIYPADRTRFMLEDSSCALVLASASLTARVDEGRACLVIDGAEIVSASDAQPVCRARPSDVCYAIYTSGSTGRPKGVVLTHRAVVNTLDWVNREFGVTSADRLLFVTSPSFDLSVYDVFGALGAGASVEVASSDLLADPQRLAQRLCDGTITIWDSAPPALARLAAFLPEHARQARLRVVMLSGDWIPLSLPPRLQQCFDGVQVKSLGGATEAAIWSNHYHLDKVQPQWNSIPYGYPIQNSRYYILDAHLRPMPAQMPGDLYIGGTCLAEGYLNRPELTAERFLPDPFLPGERIYKTGDLARYWADGTMEFLGRADFQVKIRGFRVEIGEIEAALKKLPGVDDALCTAHQDGSGQKSLVAYVVVCDPEAFDVEAARAQLARSLPDFMVPSIFLPLRGFALTSNGKVDRTLLPSPDSHRGGAALKPASTPTQAALLDIWKKVLARSAVGVDDNFFDLGGHSLAAVALVTEIKQRMGLAMPLSEILESPTVERLAERLERAQRAGDKTPAPAASNTLVIRAGGPQHFFFIHDGDGEVLLYRNLAQRMPEDFTVVGVFPRRLPSIALAHGSIEEMAACYVDEIRKLQPHGPYHLGGLCAGGVIAFEMAAQLRRAGEAVGLVLLLESFEPRTPERSHLMLKQRVHSIQGVLRPEAATAWPAGWIGKGRSLLGKLWGGLHYEVSSRLHARSVRRRHKTLCQVLSTQAPWPAGVEALRIQEIYSCARDRYAATPVDGATVVLVRASKGVDGLLGDRPSRELYEDPLLGWRAFVPNGLHTVDVPGGHMTMLQEPHVDELAAALGRFWPQHPAGRAAAPVQAAVAPAVAPV